MGFEIQGLYISFFLLACGWVAFSTDTSPGIVVKIDKKTIESTAKKSMTESNIMAELAEAATKNQAGTKAIKGIKGLKLRKIEKPITTMTFQPPDKMEMCIDNTVTIAGKSFIGGTMEITVRSQMIINSCMKTHPEKNITLEVLQCRVELVSCKTNLPSSMLPKIVNKFLNSTLVKVLPGMMCPAAEKVVVQMEKKLRDVFNPYPIGNLGSMSLKIDHLEVDPDYIGAYFEAMIQDTNGNTLEMPPGPGLPENPPTKKEGFTQVLMTEQVIETVASLYTPFLNCKISSGMDAGLTSDNMGANIPEVAGVMPASQPVNIEFLPVTPPGVEIKEGESNLKTHLKGIVSTDSGAKICEMEMVQKWPTEFTMEEGIMHFVINPETGSTEQLSMVDPSQTEITGDAAKDSMRDLVGKHCMPRFTEALTANSVTMPSLMGGGYGDTQVHKTENLLDLDVLPEEVDDIMPDISKLKYGA